MAIMKFPHFSRFIPARNLQAINFSLKSLVFVAILTFFLINVKFAVSGGLQTDMSLQKKLIVDSNQPTNYRFLVAEFLRNHDFAAASYFNNLGLSLFPLDLDLMRQKDEIYYQMNEPKFITEELSTWRKIVEKYPNYRDGFAQLMWLNLKLGNVEEAKKYLEVVKKINPNWEPLAKINF
jgi:tetratricopeptide (TPR) repeat protein